MLTYTVWADQTKKLFDQTISKCTTDCRFESCHCPDDKRLVMERLDNPLSEAELQEQELLENVQSRCKSQPLTDKYTCQNILNSN